MDQRRASFFFAFSVPPATGVDGDRDTNFKFRLVGSNDSTDYVIRAIYEDISTFGEVDCLIGLGVMGQPEKAKELFSSIQHIFRNDDRLNIYYDQLGVGVGVLRVSFGDEREARLLSEALMKDRQN
jgi:hypothetical protein